MKNIVWLVLIDDYPEIAGHLPIKIFSTRKKAYDWKNARCKPSYYYVKRWEVE